MGEQTELSLHDSPLNKVVSQLDHTGQKDGTQDRHGLVQTVDACDGESVSLRVVKTSKVHAEFELDSLDETTTFRVVVKLVLMGLFENIMQNTVACLIVELLVIQERVDEFSQLVCMLKRAGEGHHERLIVELLALLHLLEEIAKKVLAEGGFVFVQLDEIAEVVHLERIHVLSDIFFEHRVSAREFLKVIPFLIKIEHFDKFDGLAWWRLRHQLEWLIEKTVIQLIREEAGILHADRDDLADVANILYDRVED